jgi:hypothetical protein
MIQIGIVKVLLCYYAKFKNILYIPLFFSSYESMKSLVDEYNNAIDAFLQRVSSYKFSDYLQLSNNIIQAAHTKRPNERFSTTQRRTSRNLLRHILQQVYVHAVTIPSKLNQYEPFSPEVCHLKLY